MNKYKYAEGKLTIDLQKLIAEGLNNDEREALIEDALRAISFDDGVARAVIKRLAGGDYEWWSSTDPKLRHEALCKMENELMSGCRWSWLNWLKDAVRDIHNDKRIYWMLYHDNELGDRFREWCKRHGVEANYYEEKEAALAEIINKFETAIDNLKAGMPLPPKGVCPDYEEADNAS